MSVLIAPRPPSPSRMLSSTPRSRTLPTGSQRALRLLRLNASSGIGITLVFAFWEGLAASFWLCLGVLPSASGRLSLGAVVLAILGGVYAVLGYAMVVRDKGGSDAALGSVWLLITGVLAIVIVGLAVLASPRNAQNDARACPACERRADEDWNTKAPETGCD